MVRVTKKAKVPREPEERASEGDGVDILIIRKVDMPDRGASVRQAAVEALLFLFARARGLPDSEAFLDLRYAEVLRCPPDMEGDTAWCRENILRATDFYDANSREGARQTADRVEKALEGVDWRSRMGWGIIIYFMDDVVMAYDKGVI